MYWLCLTPQELELVIKTLEDAREEISSQEFVLEEELTEIVDLIVKLLYIQKTEKGSA